MKCWKKFLIGGAGGIVPVVLNLLVVDYTSLLLNLTVLVAMGYVIRVVVLFGVGGFWAALHSESNKRKLFELGILAPAIITSLINAGNAKQSINIPGNDARSSGYTLLIGDANARSQKGTFEQFDAHRESALQQLWRGFTGSRASGDWFVIAGSYSEPSTAKALADKINERRGGFEAKVYEDGANYRVVIGSHLTREAAEDVRKKAMESGLAVDAQLFQ